MKIEIKNTRCPNILKAFIEYMNQNSDQRFFQGMTNFIHAPYLGWASTPDGKDFLDLWEVEENNIRYKEE